MQDSGQNGEAMHKGIMLSGQSADNAADSVPASDNMQYVNTPFAAPAPNKYANFSRCGTRITLGYHFCSDPSSPRPAPINAPQANSTPSPAIVDNK